MATTGPIRVHLEPSRALEDMLARVVRGALAGKGPRTQGLEPIILNSPEGDRVMFVDEVGEAHWPLTKNMQAAVDRGWRQAFTIRTS